MNSFVLILLTLGAASASMRLGYQKNKRYTYNYQTDVTHAVYGGSAKTLGLRVKCKAHLDVLKTAPKTEIQFTLENIQVRQVIGSLEDQKQQQEKALNAEVEATMQQRLGLPVRVALKKDNCIKQVYAHPQDEEWSLNIKRGLVNLFQIAPRQNDRDREFVTQIEKTAVGDCQVSYAIVRVNSQADQKDAEQFTKVTKVINYEKCQNRPEFRQYTFNAEKCEKCQQSRGYAPYHRSAGQIEHTLTGSAKAGYIIKKTQAVEEHVVTPFSRSDGQVTARARQFLEYQGPAAAKQALATLTKETSHRIVVENPEERARQNAQWQGELAKQGEATVNQMCAAIQQRAGHQAAEKFANLVAQLRQCNEATLSTLADKMLARQDQSERRFCIDALSYAGTAEAAKVLMEKFLQQKLNKADDLKRVFLGLASAARPTAAHITIAWTLCNHAQVAKDTAAQRQCMLSFGALVHRIRQRPSLQQDTKAMAACKEYLQKIMERLASKQTKADEKVMYIQALGNAASTEAREKLLENLENRENDLRIRVECVWALRRILPAAREKTTQRLVAIFADARESPELRMAIFSLLLNSEPNFTTLQAVANIVKREIASPIQGPRSNQVASFCISHLAALAYHNNVLTKRRSMQARLALRLMPRMTYGLGYSKGIRFAQHSEKFQAGFELEVNKMNVPDSMLPRNMNTRIQLNMMGYKMNALEFGARIQNMDQVIEQVISEVRKRYKRSLLGNMLSWLNKESSDDDEGGINKPTGLPTQLLTKFASFASPSAQAGSRAVSKKSTGPSSHPTASYGPSTQQDPSFINDDKKCPQHMAAYIKLFGDEVKYMEIREETIKQFVQDFADLVMGKKPKIEYAHAGIVITKKAVQFTQTLEKAFQLANSRRMVPTLAGVPLDFQYRSAAVVKATAKANMNVEPSLTSLLKFEKITGSAEITPCIGAHEHRQIGIHTPYLRMGLQVKAAARANPDQNIGATFQAGKEYTMNYNLPQEQRDILHIKFDTQAFVQQKNPENCKITHELVAMDFKRHHLKKIEKSCKGQNFFGVQMCVEGQCPDLPALRLEQVPAFPTIALTELRVAMAPAADKPAAVKWKHTVDKNDEKEIRVAGQIDASSGTVTRQIPYTVTYTKATQQMVIQVQGTKAPGCEDCMLKCTANPQGMTLQFGRGDVVYEVSAAGQVEDQGKTLRLQFDWKEVPGQWRRFAYDWEPQILYFLQQFAWVRRPEQYAKQVAIKFALTSQTTADVRVKTPDAVAERTDLALPLMIERFPSSLQEIRNSLYAQCEVQGQTVKIFDNLQYQHNIKGGGCPYVLAQDHWRGKECRIKLTMKIDKQGQKTVAAKMQQSQESVVINPDQTILIDGQKADCSQKACQTKQGRATVTKVQTSDGKCQIHLTTKYGLHAAIEGQRIQVFAAPLLQSRVRGLCGDANGEQWKEFKDPEDHVQQELSKFIQSWQQKC